MRTTLLAAGAALILAAGLGACSREDAHQIKQGAQAVGDHVKDAASEIKNDPDVKEAGAAMKAAAKDAGTELKQTASDAGSAAKDASADLRQGANELKDNAKELGDKTKAAGQDAAADARKAGREVRKDIDGNPKT